MPHNHQHTQLLLSNKEWLLASVLETAKNYLKQDNQALLIYPWNDTISGIAKIIYELQKNSHKNNNKPILSQIEHETIQVFVYRECEKCSDKNIQSHIYLSFLKSIRNIYSQLIKEKATQLKDQSSIYSLIDNCFNCIEVAFFKAWEEQSIMQIKEKEKHLEETALTDVFKHLSIPILIIDPFDRVLAHNNALDRLTKNKEESENIKLDSLFNLSNNEFYSKKLDTFRKSNKIELSFEASVASKEATPVLINSKKLKHSNNIIVSLINLTHWKNLEFSLAKSKKRAEETDKLKTSFLANMSHEIRTPMNAILGFSELISSSNPNKEERKEYINLIRKSSNDLLNIIEDILDISKIESKQLKINNHATKPAEIFTDLNRIYEQTIKKHNKNNLKIILNIPEKEKNLTVRTDSKRLKQVLSNLISNAIKFTEEGQIEIGYKLAENRLIYFYVKDSGVGIPYNMQQTVFNRFSQVDKNESMNINGTGLGLAISKNIIQLLGGNIWVTSKPTKGSNFYFYLPYIKPNISHKNKKNKDLYLKNKTDLSAITILVAEDEDSNFLYIEEALRDTNITIHRALNGLEAINIAEKHSSLDLILMDVKMPEINGIDAARYIRHINPDIPIIAISAYAIESNKKASLDAGCNSHITKPINRAKLISIIQEYSIKEAYAPSGA